MPVLKFTTFFGSDQGRGWSETHLKDVVGEVGDLLPYVQAWKTILDNNRRPLLGQDRYIDGFRVSYPTGTGAVASSSYLYSPSAYPGNQRVGCDPSTAVQVRFGDVTNTRFSNSFLRGYWRDIQKNEQLDFTTAAGTAWKQLFDQYASALVGGGYGWYGQVPAFTARGTVLGYTTNPNETITFQVAYTNGVAPPAADTKYPMRFARINRGNSVLNRSFVVQQVDNTHVTTVQQVAAGPYESQGTFVATVSSFVQYTGVQYLQLARKPEGRPIGRSPARRKAQALK